MYVYVYLLTHSHTPTHTVVSFELICIYICMYMYVYVCMNMYVHVYLLTHSYIRGECRIYTLLSPECILGYKSERTSNTLLSLLYPSIPPVRRYTCTYIFVHSYIQHSPLPTHKHVYVYPLTHSPTIHPPPLSTQTHAGHSF